MLVAENLYVRYGSCTALKDVSICINEGEIVALIGSNGAGKSTLLMTLCGCPHPYKGRILLEGKDLTKIPTHNIVRLGLAQVPEGRRIFARMTVLENLQIGAITSRTSHFLADLNRVFRLFPVLAERRNQRGGVLSGGEQQMLAIGRALMSRPRLLLLDEPSLGLAPMVVKQILSILKEINAYEGVTILLVEQNAHHALRLAHRGYVMVNGTMTMCGTSDELLTNQAISTAYLNGDRVIQ